MKVTRIFLEIIQNLWNMWCNKCYVHFFSVQYIVSHIKKNQYTINMPHECKHGHSHFRTIYWIQGYLKHNCDSFQVYFFNAKMFFFISTRQRKPKNLQFQMPTCRNKRQRWVHCLLTVIYAGLWSWMWFVCLFGCMILNVCIKG
jgi:hypothetical protein